MSNQDSDFLKDIIFEAIEASLEAQLRAIRRLRRPERERSKEDKGMSKIDMAYDILKKASEPLHINEILKRIETVHQTHVERESLVSAITKKVKREDRFVRTDKNTFGIKKDKY